MQRKNMVCRVRSGCAGEEPEHDTSTFELHAFESLGVRVATVQIRRNVVHLDRTEIDQILQQTNADGEWLSFL